MSFFTFTSMDTGNASDEKDHAVERCETDLPSTRSAERSNFAELPAWDINFKWRFHRYSRIELEPEGYLNLVDEAWYVVKSIETVRSYDGYEALAYNLTIEDSFVSGDGVMYLDTDDPPDGETDYVVDITIDSDQSSMSGFQWYRVSDLSMMQDYRDLHAVVDAKSGIFGGTAIMDAKNSMQASPPEEDYDFPILTGDHWQSTYRYHNYVDYKLDLPNWINNLGVDDEEDVSDSETNITSSNWCNNTATLTNDYNSYNDCYLVDAFLDMDDGSGKQKWWYHPPAKNFARWRMENMVFAGMTVTESNNDLMDYDVWDVSTDTVSIGPRDTRIAHPGGKVPVVCDFESANIRFDADLSGEVFYTEDVDGEFVANVTVPTSNDNTIIDAAVDPTRQDVGSHGILVETGGGGTYIPKTLTLRKGDLSLAESDISLSVTDIMAGEPITISAKVFNQVDTYMGMNVNVGFYLDYGEDDVIIGTATRYGMDNGPAFSRVFSAVWSDPIPGNHTITVVVDHEDDILETDEDNNKVELGSFYINTRPEANLLTDRTVVDTYDDIIFDARASTDHEDALVSYAWDFDDGSTSSDTVVAHNFTDDGEYNVTLTVTDSDSVTDIAYTLVEVHNRAPALAYELLYTGKEKGANIGAGDEITFDASGSSDRDGFVETVHWEFGVQGGDSWDETAKYTYQSRDVYNITLTVTDNDGGINSTTFDISVANKLPVIDLQVSKERVATYTDISFDASGTKDLDPNGRIETYAWNFGDGGEGTGSKVTHQYKDDGAYKVVLEVTDNEGGVADRKISINVTNRPPTMKLTPPLEKDSNNIISLKKGLHIDASKSSDMDGDIAGYFYDPGQGGASGWVTDSTFSYLYTSVDTFTLTVKIKDDDGAIVEEDYSIEVVDNNPPTCSITFTPLKPEEGEKVKFKAVWNDPDENDVTGFMWNFGIDHALNDLWLPNSEKEIAYKEAGEYDVTLYVRDEKGLKSEQFKATFIVYKPGEAPDDLKAEEDGLPWLWIGLGVVVLIGIIVLVVIMSKGGKKEKEPEEGEKQSGVGKTKEKKKVSDDGRGSDGEEDVVETSIEEDDGDDGDSGMNVEW